MVHFFQDIYQGMSTFLAGMRVTGTYLKNANLHPKETITTIAYNGSASLAQDVKVADKFRGHIHIDGKNCIGCKSCMKVCPIDCIWVETEKTETGKLRVSRFDVDQLKCMYCGQCARACPTGGLVMTKEWWGASFRTKDNLHGQLKQFGAGYYTPAEKLEVERKKLEIAEAKKKAAAAAAAKKATPPPVAAPAADEKKAEAPAPAVSSISAQPANGNPKPDAPKA